jgi:hypothetical protein
MARHEFVVAGQHLQGNARGGHGLDGSPGPCFRRIEENSEAGEDKVALIADGAGLVAHIDHAAGNSKGTESLSTESIERGFEATACLRVERKHLAIRVLVSPR